MARVLVCCGLATLDVMQTVERVPRADEKVVAAGASVTFGGPAANAAATAVALGVPALLATRVGGSPAGALVAAGLSAAGVDLLDVAGPDDVPPVSTVLVTAATGERAVASTNATRAGETARAAGTAEDPDVAQRLAGLAAPSRWREGDVLLLDGHHHDLALLLARVARGRGSTVLLDGGSWKPGTPELLGLCDVVVLSADFRVPGEPADRTVRAVAGLGPRFVARSAGPGPIEVLSEGRERAVEVPRARRVVDTLGAGDVLHGACAAALVGGATPLAALRSAARTATGSVEHAGARGWIAARR
ncbi:PfkB family carbohydrate kinase [Cellulomonas sp. PhB143]|uniref:PfkB family carbohydrate kinase n=1 Tax=Cellulomonas sp. PhB143 TaxID=2485186 RepID=UPI000F472702|nr:PfkB family carbohydrate kinase [Cellulomonas sp. PhB143]ROS76998.1 sugar/nucleoside kinase (ribokinase family) [Cellulomonas sp. PhB143]